VETVNYISGLDLGRRSQYAALAVAEQTRDDDAGLARYAVRELRRWPPGAGHAAVLADVLGLFAAPPLAGSTLVIDGTAVGASVVEMFRRGGINAYVQEVLITAGHAVSKDETGALRVARAQLASALVALGATRRLRVVRTLPLRAAFDRELDTFTARPAPAGDEQVMADSRVGKHDDLVLAVAVACFCGERFFVGPWEPTVDPATSPCCPEYRETSGTRPGCRGRGDRPRGPAGEGEELIA
jgi:hypothetical protein